jgi:hypothetical protein
MSTARPAETPYIDHGIFLDPAFSATSFANSLVVKTNNSTDSPLDLATPLSRVLFDVKEIETHIHSLTTRSAEPLLDHAQVQTAAAANICAGLERQTGSLNETYARLHHEVVDRHDVADEVRRVAERLWLTVRLGRAVSRVVSLARQLDAQLSDLAPASTGSEGIKGDQHGLVRASSTILALRALLQAPGQEGEQLLRVGCVVHVRDQVVVPGERSITTRATNLVRDFRAASTYGSDEVRARTSSALAALWMLSPGPSAQRAATSPHARSSVGELLVAAVTEHLRAALTASTAVLARALGSLPTLERACGEVAARCADVVALEQLLSTTRAGSLATPAATGGTDEELLPPLLAALETGSLASYFWRTLAGQLAPRVQELMARGGVAARTLGARREEVRDAIRRCVLGGGEGREREVSVMVGVLGLGR